MPPRQPPDTAERFIPPDATLAQVREAARGCTACPLHKSGTQTVFGEGPDDAVVMLVGEVPGDMEDRAGRPFVGPAGQQLDRCLVEAGIDRSRTYLTNVVKHFKWAPRGKRRIHSKPNTMEIRACIPWLEAEIRHVKPKALVCLGATAAQALLGSDFRVSRDRGHFVQSPLAPYVTATVHPSSLLRIEDREAQRAAIRAFTDDLRKVAEALR